MKTFNANQISRNANVQRRRDLDFTDDGSRFSFYTYKNVVPFHICKWQNDYFISIRPDYLSDLGLPYMPYEVYSKWPEYNLLDEYNGVCADFVDVEHLLENLEAVYNRISTLIK